MKFRLIVLTALCFSTASAQTVKEPVPQPVRRNNTAYVELGGICAFYSVNYQRNIPVSKKLDVAGGISLGPVYLPNSADAKWSPRIGVQAQAIYKAGRHELGAGPAYSWYTYRNPKNGSREAYYDEVQAAFFAQAGDGVIRPPENPPEDSTHSQVPKRLSSSGSGTSISFLQAGRNNEIANTAAKKSLVLIVDIWWQYSMLIYK